MDKKLAPYIKELFELYATGNYSYKTLEKHLAGKAFIQKEIREAVDGELVSHIESYPVLAKCIEGVVCNPFYYGARRQKGKVVLTGKEKHTPLISKELFDACQKMKAIRAQHCHISLAHEIQKPFMNLMKCGVCAHAITGEIHKKANGKIYVYYHCANQTCDQKRINVRQEDISRQLATAFEPFLKLTPKAVAPFIEAIKDQVENIHKYSSEEIERLKQKKKSLESRMNDLQAMVSQGTISEGEYADILAQKKKLLFGFEVEIEAHTNASRQTILASLEVIELMGKSNAFMSLDDNELGRARLVKLVLSNLTLENKIVRYDYEKSFDDLIELTGRRNWWRLSE